MTVEDEFPESKEDAEYTWAAASFGAADRIPWLRSMGISAVTMDKLRGVSATFVHSGLYIEAATEAGMGWGMFCEYATVIPFVAVIPAYQTGKPLAEIEGWMAAVAGDVYDLAWVRAANVEGVRWLRSHGIQSPVESVTRFIRDMYSWANPDIPGEYIGAFIQHPDGLVVA